MACRYAQLGVVGKSGTHTVILPVRKNVMKRKFAVFTGEKGSITPTGCIRKSTYILGVCVLFCFYLNLGPGLTSIQQGIPNLYEKGLLGFTRGGLIFFFTIQFCKTRIELS